LLVRGPIDVPALRTALTRLGERQQALQMTVEEDVDGWWQCATADPGSGVRHVDLGALHEAGRDDRARELIARSAGADAVLGAPLLRTLVVTLAPSRTLLHFDLHHVISDDWSLDVFLCELSALYTAQLTGRSCGLAPLWLPYADYVLSALEPQPRRLAEACRFWKESLADGAASIDLVADRTRPAVLSGEGDRVRVRIGERQAARHAATARRHGMSRYMFCLAGVYAVLLAYTERDELCLGSLATVRGQAGTEQLLGYFVNLLPVRVDAGGDVTVDELFQRVKDACLAAHRHQEVPFQDVCRTLGLPGAARGSTPFQAVVNYQQRQPDALDLAGSPVEPWPVDTPGTAKFELSFAFRESGAGVDLELEFSTDLFGRSRISHLADQLATVLDRLCEDDGPLSGLDIEPPAAVRPLPLPRRPAGGTLHTLFARQAAAHPDRTAVIGDDITLDYAALDRLSDRAATRLTDHGVRPGDRVAILLERSPKLITAILGVLKAGATYVPLDPSYPDERLAHTVRDAEVRALVSSGRTGGRALTGVLAPVLDIDRLTAGDGEVSLPVSGAHDPAYIIYTSGSTGRPKGVVVSHGAVANTLQACLARHPFRQDDVWLQLTSPGFDVAAFEQFMPLISGGTLVYCDDATRGDRSALTRILRERGVTVMVTVPSLLRALDRPDLAGVRILVVAGEPADIHDTRHYAHDRIVINGYGPTEAAVLATTYQAAPGDRLARVPIGTPLAGTSGHILDRHGRPAAVGVPGELWLGGAGLAHGYWNRPQETQERFTTVPALAGGERLYRTGDRVRRLPDGGIDYLGRLDGQIKLRGFRIELGEIEAVLATVSGVNEAVAVLLGAADDAELAAAYVGTASPEQARSHLARLLPAYMVPTILTPVPALPTNSHGKADRRALTALLEQHRHLEADAAHPAETADDTERGVLELWTQVAGERVRSLDDDFFTTGGDSLRAVRLLGAIERRYGRRVALRDFLETPTVRALARQLSKPSDTGPSAPVGPQDARLAPAIVFPVPAPAPAPGEPLLLTGATGFVGAHVLYELLQRTDAPVLCLVRQDPSRIGKALDQYGLDVTSHSRRIIPVPGDLTLPGLGLDGTPWEREIRQAAAIFHLGARVHHVSGYHHLVAANVNGTAELLRIAAEGRPSRFHHISTLGVFRDDRAIRTIGETTSTADENHPRGRGYAASKWSAERLVTQAVAKGAHARLYRLGRALGSTTTGMWNQDDMLTRLAMTSAELGCYPDDTRLSSAALAVDTMARALVALALAEDHPGAVYHLHHPRPTGLRQLLAPYERRSGRRVRPVTLPAWVHTLADHPELPAYVYLEHLRDPGSGTLHYTNDSTVTHLSGLGVTLPDLDPELVERWWTGGGTVTGS
jgi:nonribosomal peptide synthetase DhbF